MTKAKLKISKVPKKLHTSTPLSKPVTIVVLTWNAIHATIGLIDSIFERPLPSNAELLFIDNGSHDYTVDYLMRYNEIEIILNGKNLGYTKAVNIGIESTTNDIVLLNNDTGILHQNWLQLLQETAYADPSTGPVGCRLINDKGDVVHAGGWVNPTACSGGNATCLIEERTEPIVTSYVTFGCVYLRRDLINQCGLLHDGYFAYYEDLDYCLTAQLKGYKSIMDGRVNLFHSESESSKSNGDLLNIDRIKLYSEMLFGTRWRSLVPLLNFPEPWPANSYPGRTQEEINAILGVSLS